MTKREICLMITDDNDDDDGEGDDYKDNTSQDFFSINLLGKQRFFCDPHFTDMEI